MHLTVVDSNGLRDDISLPVTIVDSLNTTNSSKPSDSDLQPTPSTTNSSKPSDSDLQPTPSIPELPYSIFAVMIILGVILVIAFKISKKPNYRIKK